MIKAKIGATLCLISSLIAAVVYFFIDIRIAPSMDVFGYLSFGRVYYPVLSALDLVLFMYLFLKAYASGSAYTDDDKRHWFARAMSSRVLEALLMEGYVVINVFWAYSLYAVASKDFYIPMMFAKAAFFAVLYQIQTVFCFLKQKKIMRVVTIVGIAIIAIAVYASLQWSLKDNPFGDTPLYLNILINGLMQSVGKEWPESNYWLTAAAIVGIECLLPLIRLIGLALYNTMGKKQRLLK